MLLHPVDVLLHREDGRLDPGQGRAEISLLVRQKLLEPFQLIRSVEGLSDGADDDAQLLVALDVEVGRQPAPVGDQPVPGEVATVWEKIWWAP